MLQPLRSLTAAPRSVKVEARAAPVYEVGMDTTAFRQLIPHRPPMVLIDEVIEFGPERIRARRTIRPGDPFVGHDGLDDAALLEVIAQTIAAGDALFARSKGGKVRKGYLTGLTGVKLYGQAAVGESVEVQADCLKRMEGMGLFDVQATVEGRPLAEGRFKLFVDILYHEV
jgi:predicted hotdog family 3-hydroxylacyl-ACP dehydratase